MHYSQIQDQNRRSMKAKLALAAGLFTLGIVAAFLLISHDSNAVATQVSLDNHLLRAGLFSQWKKFNNKEYTEAEEALRFQIWSQNYDFVQSFNQNQDMTFSVGMNKFADLSREEWKSFLGGCFKGPSAQTNVQSLPTTNAASSVDWRKNGAVTPVKNQGQCGSCWAFSSTGSLEGLNFISTKKLLSFSEQQLVDCSQSAGNQGCNGGLMDYAFKYVSQKGIELEATYPYTAETGTCSYSASKTKFKNTAFTDVPQQDNNALAAAVAQQPVSIAIEADSQSFQMYTGGVYNDPTCGTQLDHGVLIVGYGVNGTSPYWIVKNSWGATWGESGYIRIAKQNGTGAGICGIALSASYPTGKSEAMEMIEIKPIMHPVEPEVRAREEAEESEEEGSEEESREEEDVDSFVSPYEDLASNVQDDVYAGIAIPEDREEESEEESGEEGSEEEGSEEEAGSEEDNEDNENPIVSNIFISQRLHPIATENEEGEEEESSEEGSEEEGSEEEAGSEEDNEDNGNPIVSNIFISQRLHPIATENEEGEEEESSEEGSEEESSEEEGSEEEGSENKSLFDTAVDKVQHDLLVSEMLHGHYYGIGPVLPADGLRKYLGGHEEEGEEEEQESSK